MNSSELITAVRLAGRLSDADPDYTDARILVELTDALNLKFARVIVAAREGYWLQQAVTTCTAGLSTYRIPPRAVTGGLEKVECSTDGSTYYSLAPVDQRKASAYENQSGTPARYEVLGDQVKLLPTPSSTYSVRMTYYIRPNALTALQTAGRITTIDTSARTLVVNTAPSGVTTGTTLIDVVHPDGWHELALVGASQTLASTTFTLAAGTDMTRIAVGDYVVAAQTTYWPALPDDFHRTLSDIVAAVICVSLGKVDLAQALGTTIDSDLGRFRNLIQPRVRAAGRLIKPQYGGLRLRGWRLT